MKTFYAFKKPIVLLSSFIAFFTISTSRVEAKLLSIMAYNVENLFDTVDDPDKRDEEFTPGGKTHWTRAKLKKKYTHLGQVVRSIKNEDGSLCPDVLGLVEVENHFVLKEWKEEYLKSCGYHTIIIDPVGSDMRGIKVSMMTKLPLYKNYKPRIHHVYHGARLILEVPLSYNDQPLIVFVNHWKSRAGRDPDQGEEKRFRSARVLKKRMDEINNQNPYADMIILGDLNDEPEDAPVKQGLGVVEEIEDLFNDLENSPVWNPSVEIVPLKKLLAWDRYNAERGDPIDLKAREDQYRKARATYYWKAGKQWNQLDHILMSRGLFDNEGFRYVPKSFRVIRHPKFTDQMGAPIPYRPGYWDGKDQDVGGASDHFPLLAILYVDE